MKTEKITAIYPDSWNTWEFVELDNDTYTDSSWAGCDYRVSSGPSKDSAINVHVTGRTSKSTGWGRIGTWKTRVRIEFVGDGQPSTFASGIVYSDSSLFE